MKRAVLGMLLSAGLLLSAAPASADYVCYLTRITPSNLGLWVIRGGEFHDVYGAVLHRNLRANVACVFEWCKRQRRLCRWLGV